MLAVMASITCVYASALENGIYIAKSTSHYRHPVTGEIEDSGGENSEVLGQSMTESALYPEALIEVDTQGKMFATVRLKLMDNIEEPSFKVQNRSDSGFWDVDYDIMKEDFDNNESDFRFEIPNENCIIRATFYVVPMGRDVIFYIDFSDIHEGSSDFVTSVEIKKPETQPIATETKPVETQPAPTQTKKSETVTSKPTMTDKKTEKKHTETKSEKTEASTTKRYENSTETDEQITTKVTSKTSSSKSTSVTSKISTKQSTSSSENSAEISSHKTTTTVTTAAAKKEAEKTEEYTIPETIDNNVKGAAFFDENGNEIFPLSKNGSKSTGGSGNPASGNRSAAVPVGIACGVAAVFVFGGIIVFRRRRL
jgi:chemotaxis protein histidine kinase CheA